jgi:molybdenum cofactor biosynthesis enzyme MoaA
MENKFCPHAYNAIEVTTSGTFKPCCVSSKRFQNSAGKEFTADKNSIMEVYNSADRADWVKNFNLNFEKDCKQCYQVEKSNGESKRLREIKYWKHYYNSINEPVPYIDINRELEVLDLKLGNACNLACSTCAPDSSSKWNSLYKSHLGEQAYHNNHWQDTEEFWNGLTQQVSKVKKIEIAGGEPFMNKKQRILLNYLVENDLAKNIDITWITNSTFYEEDIINLFPKFKMVRVMVSLDNTHERFEYMRYPAVWESSYEIFKKFNKLKELGVIELGISYTISALNIFHVTEMWDFAKDHQVSLFNNLVMWPFHCKNLPMELKLKVKDKIEKYVDNSWQTNPAGGENSWLVEFMMQHHDNENIMKRFNEHLKFVNSTRPGLFEKAFPELTGYLYA